MVTSKTTEEWNAEQGIGPSTVLGGRYRVRRLLGEGGMGRVFLATDLREKRDVAVKVLTDERPIPKAEERFIREARSTEKINHPNVVAIFDIGHSPRGGLFFVMEYLDGEELAVTIEREGRLPWPRVQHIALQICGALGAAHTQGVVHRDLKLEMCHRVTRGGYGDFIKILDFGIAKLMGGDPSSSGRLTNTGAAIGTPAYMAPELCRGKDVDHRVDIYALGVMIYEMICGTVPFLGDAFLDVALQHMNDPPPPMSTHISADEFPPELEAVVMKALAKKREDRYPTMEAMASAIREIADATESRSTSVYDGVRSKAAAWSDSPSQRLRVLSRDVNQSEDSRRMTVVSSETEAQSVSAPMPVLSLNRPTSPSARLPASGRSQTVDTSTEWEALRPGRGGWIAAAVVLLLAVTAVGGYGLYAGWGSAGESGDPSATAAASAEGGEAIEYVAPRVEVKAASESETTAAATPSESAGSGGVEGPEVSDEGPSEADDGDDGDKPRTPNKSRTKKNSRRLSSAQIDQTLASRVKRALHICGGAATGGKKGDRIKMSISIDLQSGKVSKARVVKHDTTAKARGCVRDLVLKASFPVQGTRGTQTVTRTFTL